MAMVGGWVLLVTLGDRGCELLRNGATGPGRFEESDWQDTRLWLGMTGGWYEPFPTSGAAMGAADGLDPDAAGTVRAEYREREYDPILWRVPSPDQRDISCTEKLSSDELSMLRRLAKEANADGGHFDRHLGQCVCTECRLSRAAKAALPRLVNEVLRLRRKA